MRVLEKHEPAQVNHCIICGQGLDRNRQDIVIDTGYDFDQPGDPLDGRKYVGQCCVWSIAKAAGLMTATEVQEVKQHIGRYRAETDLLIEGTKAQLKYALSNLEALPSAPDLGHLNAPDHVLVAEGAKKTEDQRQADWVDVPSKNEAPF